MVQLTYHDRGRKTKDGGNEQLVDLHCGAFLCICREELDSVTDVIIVDQRLRRR